MMHVAIGLTAVVVAAASPEARQVYAPTWMTTVVQTEPCVLSVALPASEAEHCASWTRRESSGPAFHSGLGVLVTGGSDRQLRAIDATNGALIWQRPTPGAVVSQPTIDGGTVVVGTDDARVIAVDVASGRERWTAAVDAEITEPVVVFGDAVFVVTGADSAYALAKETGEALWVHKHPLPRAITLRGQGRPLAIDVPTFEGMSRRLYVGHATGRLTVLDRADGHVITELDVSRGDTFGDLDADPIFHVAQGGRVIAASQTRGVVAIEPVGHAEVWRTPEAGLTRLAAGGERLVVAAGAGKVLALDAVTGAIVWRFTFEKGAPTRIVVKGGRVHVGSDRGALYVLDLFSGRPLQYAGSAVGVAGDLALWNDMLWYTSTAGRLVALSGAWSGPVLHVRGNNRVRRP
jgi:outer membrane protein assembly factor BamB